MELQLLDSCIGGRSKKTAGRHLYYRWGKPEAVNQDPRDCEVGSGLPSFDRGYESRYSKLLRIFSLVSAAVQLITGRTVISGT